jgi:hypothetical protein
VRAAFELPAQEGLALERTLFCDLMVRPEALVLMAEAAAGRRDIRDRPRPAGDTQDGAGGTQDRARATTPLDPGSGGD